MKKFLTLTLVILLAITSLGVSFTVASSNEIAVYLNGERMTFDVPPQIIDNRTMVPMRAIFEALNAWVYWSGNTQTITATGAATTVEMQVGNPIITVNGNEITLDVPPMIIDNRTLVPVRAVAESFDAEVEWDAETQTVSIQTTPYHNYVTITAERVVTVNLRNGGVVEMRPTGEITLWTADGQLIFTGSSGADVPNVPALTASNRYDRLYNSANTAFERIYPRLRPFIYTRSQIVLPNRRLTDEETQEWIAEYHAMGGASAFELEVIRLINEVRREHNLVELRIHPELMLASRFYAQTLANALFAEIRHTIPGGTAHNFGPYGGSGGTAQAFGIRNRQGANLATGGWTPEVVVNIWMNSPPHRANLLRAGIRYVGVGAQQIEAGPPYTYFMSAPSRTVTAINQDSNVTAGSIFRHSLNNNAQQFYTSDDLNHIHQQLEWIYNDNSIVIARVAQNGYTVFVCENVIRDWYNHYGEFDLDNFVDRIYRWTWLAPGDRETEARIRVLRQLPGTHYVFRYQFASRLVAEFERRAIPIEEAVAILLI